MKFKILTICIAGVCIEYEDCDSKFSSSLEQLLSSQNISETSASSKAKHQEELPKTFAEYHKAELQRDRDLYNHRLPLLSGIYSLTDRSEMELSAEKLEYLWNAVVFSHYADVLLVPTIIAHGPFWDLNSTLLRGIFSKDLLTPRAYRAILEMAYSCNVGRRYPFEEEAMVSSLTTIWSNYIKEPARVDHYGTEVIVHFRVARIG